MNRIVDFSLAAFANHMKILYHNHWLVFAISKVIVMSL